MALGPTTRRRQLGAELRELRAASGLTLDEAGKAAGVSRGTVHRYERSGSDSPVRWPIVDALCKAYGASDAQRSAVVDLAREVKIRGWWQSFAGGNTEWIKPLVTLEDEATEVRHWANTFVPGILQTRQYAECVLRACEPHASADEIEEMADFRLRRQEILTRDTPPHLWVIMDECAIRRTVGGPAVMADQLDYLHRRAQDPHITVQVLPFSAGAHAAESNSFVILSADNPALDVVHIGNLSGALYLDKDEELARHKLVFGELRASALTESASSVLISTVSSHLAAESKQ